MPVYEFRCNACGAKVALFFRSFTADATGECDRCGSTDMRRLMSRVAVIHAQVKPQDLNKGELLHGVDYSNPTSMANFFRKMGDTFQDGKDEVMDEIIGRLDRGEAVEHALGLDDHTGHAHEPDFWSPAPTEGGGEE